MTMNDSRGASAASPGVEVERVLQAPRELVWQVWTEPEHVMRWYGPQGMTSHACRIDFRVGGSYHLGLRSPEGFEYWNTGVFREIVPIERIVATMCLADGDGNVVTAAHYGMPDDAPSETLLTVVFDDLGDGTTRLTLRQDGWPSGAMASGAAAGWNQAFDKMAALLGERA